MNSRRIILGLGVLFILVLLVWAVRGGQQRFSWRETFKVNSKEPYGLYGLYGLLDNYAGVQDFRALEDSLASNLPEDIVDGPANYLFVGGGLFMRPQDRDALLEFVSAGNTAFISAKVLPFDLMFYLYYDECDYLPWDGFSEKVDSTLALNFVHSSLKRGTDFNYKFIPVDRSIRQVTQGTLGVLPPFFSDQIIVGENQGLAVEVEETFTIRYSHHIHQTLICFPNRYQTILHTAEIVFRKILPLT